MHLHDRSGETEWNEHSAAEVDRIMCKILYSGANQRFIGIYAGVVESLHNHPIQDCTATTPWNARSNVANADADADADADVVIM